MTVRECALRWRVYHDQFRVCVPFNRTRRKDYGATFKYRGRVGFLANGRMFVVEPGGAHETLKLSGPGTFYVISFLPRLVEEALLPLGIRMGHFREILVSRPAAIGPFTALWRAANLGRPEIWMQGSLDRCLESLFPLFEVPLRLPRTNGGAGDLERVREYLHAHATTFVSSKQLENLSGLSRFHLSRVFAKRYGLSPHAYQIALRVQMAKDALRRDPLTNLADLAADVGFADQSHLGREFLRATGVSPGRYRSEARRDGSRRTIVL
jgi:AraC-like DNA-binding protein